MAPSTQHNASAIDELLDEIEQLGRENHVTRSISIERRILRLRHQAGILLCEQAAAPPEFAEPAFDQLTERPGAELPDTEPSDLSPELLRAAILRDGCLLVRGLVHRNDAARLAAEIDRSFQARKAHSSDGGPTDGYYEEFVPDPAFRGGLVARSWIDMGGGLLAADSPQVALEMFEIFENAGLRQTIGGYLGERPTVSVEKCTLRRAEPSVGGSWHQDGTFMSDVRSVNVWLSLSHCGDEAPGLDLVPRRLEHLVSADGGKVLIDVSQATVEEAAGEWGVLRPIFEPGDALIFDDLFLHRTAVDPEMDKPRYAIESWFFGPSGFPESYAPLIF